ncbi:MAG TPA: serine hydrolase [Chloroflexota bacterium]|nr:serine hydrolase [Chloroflexota bacterium]
MNDPKGFDRFAGKVLRDWKVNGAAVAAIEDGKVILCRGYGLRDAENRKPVTEHTLFPLASVTKAFTAASLATLVDEGKLDWDRPVREYLPDFRLWDDFAGERITPRDLLTHRSGLPRHDLMWYGSPLPREEIIHRLRHLRPTADLRALYQYQNLMYMAAGYLAGKLAGSSWEEVVRSRLLDPIGMVSTHFSVRDIRSTEDHALPYAKIGTKVREIPYYEDQEAIGPAGALVSNVADMARWLQVHLNGGLSGEKRVLSEAQVRELHTPVTAMEPGRWPEMPQSTYAMGWVVQPYRGHMMLQHTGGIDGFSTIAALLPDERSGVVVLTNMGGSSANYVIAFNLLDRLLGLDQVPWNQRFLEDNQQFEEAAKRAKKRVAAKRVRSTRPSHPLEAYAGTYTHPAYGPITISLDGTALKLRYHHLEADLKHYHYDTFLAENQNLGIVAPAQFLSDVRGTISGLSAPLEPTGDDIVFSHAPDESLQSADYLSRFTGSYDLMGYPVTVTAFDGTLQVKLPGEPEYRLRPLSEGSFAVEGPSSLTIEFDEQGVTIARPESVLTASRK